MKIKLLISIVLLAFLFSCHQQVNDEMIYFGPDQKVPIVFYFKKGTTNEEINYFLDNVLGSQRSDGKGKELLKGIQGQFMVRTQDYQGYALDRIDENERENILKAINSSPLIYKVFENVVPNEIVLDPEKAKQEKEELEKLKNDNRPKKTIVVTNSTENK